MSNQSNTRDRKKPWQKSNLFLQRSSLSLRSSVSSVLIESMVGHTLRPATFNYLAERGYTYIMELGSIFCVYLARKEM